METVDKCVKLKQMYKNGKILNISQTQTGPISAFTPKTEDQIETDDLTDVMEKADFTLCDDDCKDCRRLFGLESEDEEEVNRETGICLLRKE